jgi:hypothetical protein
MAMDVTVRLRDILAKEAQTARDEENKQLDKEEAAADLKKAKQHLLDLADYYAQGGTLHQHDIGEINIAAGDAGCDPLANFLQHSEVFLHDSDPGNDTVNQDKKTFDTWEKSVQRSTEEVDDDKSVREIKLQELNSTMMSADAAQSDALKQTSELDKKLRDNVFAAPV